MRYSSILKFLGSTYLEISRSRLSLKNQGLKLCWTLKKRGLMKPHKNEVSDWNLEIMRSVKISQQNWDAYNSREMPTENDFLIYNLCCMKFTGKLWPYPGKFIFLWKKWKNQHFHWMRHWNIKVQRISISQSLKYMYQWSAYLVFMGLSWLHIAL